MGSLVGGFFPLIATSLYAWTGRPGRLLPVHLGAVADRRVHGARNAARETAAL